MNPITRKLKSSIQLAMLQIACEGALISLDRALAMKSKTFKHMIEEIPDTEEVMTVTIPDVNEVTLKRIIEFMKLDKQDDVKKEEIKVESKVLKEEVKEEVKEDPKPAVDDELNIAPIIEPDYNLPPDIEELLGKLNNAEMIDIVLAANWMDYQKLLDTSTLIMARMIKGKTVEEMRAILNQPNDLTAEDLKTIDEELAWLKDPEDKDTK